MAPSSPVAAVARDVDVLPPPWPPPPLLQAVPGVPVFSGVEDGVDGDSSRPMPLPFLPLREMGRLLRLE